MEDTNMTPAYAQQISQAEYDRQTVEYTTAAIEQLNEDVRNQPSVGAKSRFFQDPANVQKGLPVFQGKHTRFVYDDEEEEIVEAVDVTHAPIPGPQVRTTEDLDSSDEEEEEHEEEYDEEDDYEEEYEDQDDDMGVENEFYHDEEGDEEHDEDGDVELDLDDEHLQNLLQNIAMELADVDLHAPDAQQ
ncbi:hypothetical protein Poli38472_013040 [Pythium oligandrum]|uniref:Uncharacterized protein n=1 Tax=Pythium oligandrum TaxID=41045 RepID=A0A8K1CL99_PYTOL|nr:hypothetical protein Poli38472_013040 [Pythium oligandrum]|eukprot:TMW64418.1 hypothetical protein Poli38472_013040 [Pythium oligandrum]